MTSLLPHHDGSALYLSNGAPKIGDKVEVRIRVPADFGCDHIILRFYIDGEPRTLNMVKYKSTKIESWWSVKMPIRNTTIKYRFLMVGKDCYYWLTNAGLINFFPTSDTDFRVIAKPATPKWLASSVFYQIFPDRFANSGSKKVLEEWVVPRNWEELPSGKNGTMGREYFGGDMDGVTLHLDYIKDLGVNGIYFTPFFPARSTHRYDASSFDFVDPMLGGNEAFINLVKSAHKVKIHVLGDLTTNHTGAGHPWLEKGKRDKKSKERGYYFWDRKIKQGYVGWWDLASLPKLNFSSTSLRKVFYSGKNAIVRKWLRAPFNLDGWRIDVGNMTGRFAEVDFQQEVMRGIRKAMDETNPNAWLVAENGDWQPEDLDGLGWHGTMNYEGFMRPLYAWLGTGVKVGQGFHGLPIDPPKFSGHQLVNTMKTFNSAIPWRSLVASMTMLNSHDTARFRTICGGEVDRHLAGMVLLLSYPGVPALFAGDEIGLEGVNGEDSRRTMPWAHPDTWDHEFHSEVKKLISLRKNSAALTAGGLRFIAVSDNYFAFLRESESEILLIVVWRGSALVNVPIGEFGYRISDTLYGERIGGDSTPAFFTISTATAGAGIYKLSVIKH